MSPNNAIDFTSSGRRMPQKRGASYTFVSRMSRIATLLLGLLLSTAVLPDGLSYPLEPFSDPKVYKSGEWELRIYYRHKGTVDEAMNGELLLGGKRPIAVVPPQFLQTPFGAVTFFVAPKHFDQLDYKRMVVGWTFVDYKKTPWTIQPRPEWEPRSDWKEVKPQFSR